MVMLMGSYSLFVYFAKVFNFAVLSHQDQFKGFVYCLCVALEGIWVMFFVFWAGVKENFKFNVIHDISFLDH